MINWEKIGRTETPDGSVVTYAGAYTHLTIESRKRSIPHANRSGSWEHTTYWLLYKGIEQKEFHTLKDAKEFAEVFQNGEGGGK